MPLQAGLTATVERRIGADDLAPALESGDVPVLGSPRLIAWCEAATVAAVAGHLDDGETTVGMRVHVDHVAPTIAGRTVTAEAHLSRIEGRRLTFDVGARDGDTPIASGQIIRVVVDRERFLERVDDA